MRDIMEFSNDISSDYTFNDSPDEEDFEVNEPEPSGSPTESNLQESEVYEFPHLSPVNSHMVKNYYSKYGVQILPEIPEEQDEYIDDTPSNNFIDPKRISRISAKLEELNQKYSCPEILNINDLVVSREKVEEKNQIQNIEYIPNYKDKNQNILTEMEVLHIQSCCACPTYKVFVWKRRFRICRDLLMDYFCRPLFTALKDPHFYPTLISKISLEFISMVYITIAPHLALRKNDGFKEEDSAFLLSYMAFSWCLFLVLLPLVIQFNKRKMGIIHVVGLVLCSGSLICEYIITLYIYVFILTFPCNIYKAYPNIWLRNLTWKRQFINKST